VLTVRYERLGLRSGERLLDLGCGGGRHAYEAGRLGARVAAADMDLAELKEVRQLAAGMREAGELTTGTVDAVGGDALRLPFPDAAFDRVVASEVMEHIPDDRAAADALARVLRPGGTLAVTVPSWLPEQVCWKLSDEYHAPFVPGGHVRIYTKAAVCARLQGAGLETTGTERTHGLHSPYWWLKCAVGPRNDEHPLVRAYHRLLVWDIVERPLATRAAEAVLGPILGKSLVVYARKPEPR
jgi:SAM-dependent methyltransferase